MELKKRLPEYENGLGANLVHEESQKIANDLMQKAMQEGDNFIYPIVGANEAKLANLLLHLKE